MKTTFLIVADTITKCNGKIPYEFCKKFIRDLNRDIKSYGIINKTGRTIVIVLHQINEYIINKLNNIFNLTLNYEQLQST